MKTTVTIFVFLIASVCVSAQNKQANDAKIMSASINWASSTTYDFGTVKKGVPVTATFEFTNNGSEPLIISDAKGSCGCTSVEYSQKPIAHGVKGFVKATFNAASIGSFYKSVTVSNNTADKTVMLYIKGQVIE